MSSRIIAGAAIMVAIFFAAGIVHAQTSSPSSAIPGATATTTPGVPSTGAGGNADVNGITLGASALLMLAGSAYIIRSIAKSGAGAHE